jgi:hypothetical protein
MIPDVTLLSIDQIAKSAMPRTAKTEEKTTAKSSKLAPKTKASIKHAIKKRLTVI